MVFNSIDLKEYGVNVCWGLFGTSKGAKEIYAMLNIIDLELNTQQQFEVIEDALDAMEEALAKTMEKKADDMTLVWRRYFVSDAANQRDFIPPSALGAISIVQQPPLNGARVALWAYFAEGGKLQSTPDGTWVYRRPNYTHLYDLQMHCREGDSAVQTRNLFNSYCDKLKRFNAGLSEHCLRTWIYVQNIDTRYKAMADERRELFAEAGMTPSSHFITSTGIEGRYLTPETLVLMDAYAVPEIKPEQIRYLHGSTHLNPTHEYGVTFERGVCIQYGGRRHIHIAGTASIDNRGEIVHPLDVAKQTARALENVSVLLAEADSGLHEICSMIVYLRDMADYPVVRTIVEAECPYSPKVYVQAAVCRPGWLVELECVAITDRKSRKFGAF